MVQKKTSAVRNNKQLKAKTKRQLTIPKRTPRRLRQQIKRSYKPLPSGWQLFRSAVIHLWKYRRIFGAIILIYLLMTIVFKGLSNADLSSAKSTFATLFHGKSGKITASFSLFGLLLSGKATSTGQASDTFQTTGLLLIISLTYIYALRQTHAGQRLSVREAFYKSPYPLIPFLLILLVIGLQLLPLVLANFLYSLLFGAGLAANTIEQVAGATVLLGLVSISLYWLSSSIFALYIVTLPDMTPLQALRSARELVRFRRFMIIKILLVLPLLLLVIVAALVVPVIFTFTAAAIWIYTIFTSFALAIIHSYLYGFYRRLI